MPLHSLISGVDMPKGKTRILKANTHIIILKATVGKDYRIAIPKAIQNLLQPTETVTVTIEKEAEES